MHVVPREIPRSCALARACSRSQISREARRGLTRLDLARWRRRRRARLFHRGRPGAGEIRRTHLASRSASRAFCRRMRWDEMGWDSLAERTESLCQEKARVIVCRLLVNAGTPMRVMRGWAAAPGILMAPCQGSLTLNLTVYPATNNFIVRCLDFWFLIYIRLGARRC